MAQLVVALMGLFYVFVSNALVLVMKPVSLCKIASLIGARIVGDVAVTWLHFVKAVVNFHLDVGWKITIWTIALLSLPLRVLMALQREKLLEDHLREVQIQLENLVWEKQDVEEHLQAALKDHQIMEATLAEVEDEHDKNLAKVEELESELRDLREENLRLKETGRKDLWDAKVHDAESRFSPVGEYGVSSWNSGLNGSGRMTLQDLLLLHGNEWEHGDAMKLQKSAVLKPGSKAARTYPFSPWLISSNLAVEEALNQRKYTAVLQSLFSTLLSVLVGVVIWEAKDPCMPLVLALFTVVGISLKSVVQFFSTIKVKPASDAIGLLSFNCFILGTITYPSLPAVARMLVPPTLKLAARMISWFGFSA